MTEILSANKNYRICSIILADGDLAASNKYFHFVPFIRGVEKKA